MIAVVNPFPSAVRRTRQHAAATAAALALLASCAGPQPEIRPALPADGGPGLPVQSNADDVARYLAGLPGDARSPYAGLRQTAAWQLHSDQIDTAYRTADYNRLDRAESWAASAIGDIRSRARGGTVFYPFSGPDYLFADTFFPGAQTYILFGLEPVRPVPDPTTYDPNALARVRASLTSLFSASYFVTKEMRQDFGGSGVPGILTSLYVFIARSGHAITGVQPVALTPDGRAVPRASFGGYNSGVRIAFSDRRGRPQELFYFQTNVANGSLSPGLVAFVRGRAPTVTFMKSASYLMHTGGFSSIRNTILSVSSAIVQDDSAIPFRSLNEAGFVTELFGTYRGTLDIFSEYYQADLAAVWARSQPLGFGVGYQRSYNQAPLIVARRGR